MKATIALWQRNMKDFVRDRTRLIITLLFPFFFIYVFSSIFKTDHIENPVTYMLTGVIISTIFDSAFRVSSSTIDDMTSGFMKEVLVSPISRFNIALGQFISSATIASIQGLLMLIVGFFIGLKITNFITIILIILIMIFVGFAFAGFGLFIASTTKNTQTFQIVSMAITMPITFLSGAYIPFSLIPVPLKIIGHFNPLTYAIMLFRIVSLEKYNLSNDQLILEELALKIGNITINHIGSIFILTIFAGLFLTMSTRTFLKIDFSKMNRNKKDLIDW